MDTTWTIPKNIRQIGETSAHYSIYIEDYVSTYIWQFSREMDGAFGQGILLGKAYPDEEKTIYVIKGIVTDKKTYRSREELFSPDGLKTLYAQRDQFFSEMEIIGGVVFDSGPKRIDTVWMKELAKKLGMQHLFLHTDYTDKSLAFCIGSQGAIEIVEGYYIYYDQNEAMQNYLVTYNEETHHKVEEIHDVISGQARAAMGGAHPIRYRVEKETVLLCATCMLLICVCLLGIVNINHYQKMCRLEASLDRALARLMPDGKEVPVSGDAVLQTQDGDADAADSGAASSEDDLFSDIPVYLADSTQDQTAAGDGQGSQEQRGTGQSGETVGSGESTTGQGQSGTDQSGETVGSGESAAGQGQSGTDQNGETGENGESAPGQGQSGTGQSGETGENGESAPGQGQSGTGQSGTGQSGETGGSGESATGQGQSGTGQSGETVGSGESVTGQGQSGTGQSGETGENGESATGQEGTADTGQPAMATYREYTVQKGDTLTSISLLFYQDRGRIKDICELNGIVNADNIMAGQKILLP